MNTIHIENGSDWSLCVSLILMTGMFLFSHLSVLACEKEMAERSEEHIDQSADIVAIESGVMSSLRFLSFIVILVVLWRLFIDAS